MRKLTLIVFLTVFCAFGLSADNPVQKPKVMVVPEEAFCINQGYYKTDENNEKVADYTKAMLSNEILDVINSFENLMAGYGFQLVNLKQTLDDLNEESALEYALTSKDGSFIREDDLDQLSRVARADILVKVSPRLSNYGPERCLELRVSSIDCASKKAIRAFGPITKTSAGTTSMLITAAVSDNIEAFAAGLSSHFAEMRLNGRECSLVIKLAESCPMNFESELTYNGETGELGELIEYWISENTVNGAYTGGKQSKSSMKFDQLHIPLSGKSKFGKEKSWSISDFVNSGLTKLLESYKISVSIYPIGIGKAYITLGSK